MSPPKGNSNSSKTAHVMNLLRKSNPTPSSSQEPMEGQPEQSSAPASAPASTPAPAPQLAPILTALNADAEIASQIRDALAEALEEEETTLPPSVPTPPLTFNPEPPAPAPDSNKKMSQDEIEKMLAAMMAPEPEPTPKPEPIPEPIPEPPSPAPVKAVPSPFSSDHRMISLADVERILTALANGIEPEPKAAPVVEQPPVAPAPVEEKKAAPSDEPELANIMQVLVERQADKYIKMFGLCTCSRCKNDVMAIVLNSLPPQYAVMKPSELQIQTDMFSNRHSGEITAQLMRACTIVMENPRH